MKHRVSVAGQTNLLTEHVSLLGDTQIQGHAECLVGGNNQPIGEENKQTKSMTEAGILLQTMAHELKNPLTMIVDTAEILQESHQTMLSEELELWLGRIVQHGLKMNNIIDELMLLSSLTKTKVEIRPLDMANIVRDSRQQLAEMIEAYQARIKVPPTWPEAVGYAPWVERVWVNYLSNALKYGGQFVRIELGARRQTGGMVRFWVRDNGPGLTSEEQVRLFKPFTRFNGTQVSGHGLGLSIVQRLVTALDGRVGVESAGVSGQGCVFFFTLPGGKG
jgi:two-component system sensor histidine kinase/response regulator